MRALLKTLRECMCFKDKKTRERFNRESKNVKNTAFPKLWKNGGQMKPVACNRFQFCCCMCSWIAWQKDARISSSFNMLTVVARKDMVHANLICLVPVPDKFKWTNLYLPTPLLQSVIPFLGGLIRCSGVSILPTQTLHYSKGNPWKLLSIVAFSPSHQKKTWWFFIPVDFIHKNPPFSRKPLAQIPSPQASEAVTCKAWKTSLPKAVASTGVAPPAEGVESLRSTRSPTSRTACFLIHRIHGCGWNGWNCHVEMMK